MFGIIVARAYSGAGNYRRNASSAATIRLNRFPEGVGVTIITAFAGLGGDIGVVVITVYIGADAIAVSIANAGAGGRRTGTVAVGVDEVIEGGVVAIVTCLATSEGRSVAIL